MRRDQVDKKIPRKGLAPYVTSSKRDDISGLQKVEMSCIACGKVMF